MNMNKKQLIGVILLLGGGILAAVMGLLVNRSDNSSVEATDSAAISGVIQPAEKSQIPEDEQANPVPLTELKADDATVQQEIAAEKEAQEKAKADDMAKAQEAVRREQEEETLRKRRAEAEQQQQQAVNRVDMSSTTDEERQALKVQQAEIKSQRALEAKQQAEEKRKAEQAEARKREQLEAKRQAEAEKRKAEQAEVRKREQLEAKRQAEAEKRKAEQAEARKREQLEAKRKAEAEKRKAEQAEAKRKAEADKKKSSQDKRQWMVQIALASDRENANKQIAKLRASGYRVITSPTSKGIRVMVGPHKDKATAEVTRQKIIADPKLNMRSAWVNGWVPLKDR